jgi:hypothetical protein
MWLGLLLYLAVGACWYAFQKQTPDHSLFMVGLFVVMWAIHVFNFAYESAKVQKILKEVLYEHPSLHTHSHEQPE